MDKNASLDLGALKKQLADCFRPNPWIYWTDFLGSCLVGYGAFVATEFMAPYSFAQIALFLVSVFALYRAVLFTHEVSHQSRRDLPGFSVAYNLFAGIPFLVPSFMYRGVHLAHHKKNSYSTHEDGEYIPFGAHPFWKSVAYIAQSFVIPFAMVFRFSILAPISLVHPKLRQLVMKRASAMAIRFDADRKIPTGVDLRNWYVLEFCCFLYVWAMAFLFASGTLPMSTLVHIYALVVAAFLANSTRTVVAHRYRNKEFQELSFADQLIDSVNLEGNPIIGELMAPVGLRFHGMHHLFAVIPYHNLGIAHRRLRATLPADSIYHLTVEPGLLAAFRTHFRNTRSEESWPAAPVSAPAPTASQKS